MDSCDSRGRSKRKNGRDLEVFQVSVVSLEMK